MDPYIEWYISQWERVGVVSMTLSTSIKRYYQMKKEPPQPVKDVLFVISGCSIFIGFQFLSAVFIYEVFFDPKIWSNPTLACYGHLCINYMVICLLMELVGAFFIFHFGEKYIINFGKKFLGKRIRVFSITIPDTRFSDFIIIGFVIFVVFNFMYSIIDHLFFFKALGDDSLVYNQFVLIILLGICLFMELFGTFFIIHFGEKCIITLAKKLVKKLAKSP